MYAINGIGADSVSIEPEDNFDAASPVVLASTRQNKIAVLGEFSHIVLARFFFFYLGFPWD